MCLPVVVFALDLDTVCVKVGMNLTVSVCGPYQTVRPADNLAEEKKKEGLQH